MPSYADYINGQPKTQSMLGNAGMGNLLKNPAFRQMLMQQGVTGFGSQPEVPSYSGPATPTQPRTALPQQPQMSPWARNTPDPFGMFSPMLGQPSFMGAPAPERMAVGSPGPGSTQAGNYPASYQTQGATEGLFTGGTSPLNSPAFANMVRNRFGVRQPVRSLARPGAQQAAGTMRRVTPTYIPV